MEAVASLYAAAEALAAELERSQQDPERLKKVVEDKDRFEYEAWKAAGCPNMEAKDGDELREWRGVGFPMWFVIKSMKTYEPVQNQEQTTFGASNQADAPSDASRSSDITETSADAMVETAFGLRKAIANTPLPAGKVSILGGGRLVEYTFDDAYREDQKAYMEANGLKGLSASRWA
ncbi:hypothetical protein PG993_001726 [Apiospora rasikravindrae]|uniref:Uncharacterized protein n=1 Tax=Apiospora rasikravindrae TaxID=990691 RepID=A0ABR1UC81_9PEZI